MTKKWIETIKEKILKNKYLTNKYVLIGVTIAVIAIVAVLCVQCAGDGKSQPETTAEQSGEQQSNEQSTSEIDSEDSQHNNDITADSESSDSETDNTDTGAEDESTDETGTDEATSGATENVAGNEDASESKTHESVGQQSATKDSEESTTKKDNTDNDTGNAGNTTSGWSPTAYCKFDDARLQALINSKLEGNKEYYSQISYPTVDFKTIKEQNFDKYFTKKELGSNCVDLTIYKYLDEKHASIVYEYQVASGSTLTWPSEIPMYQYVNWNGNVGFFMHKNATEEELKLEKTLFTIDWYVALQDNNVVRITFGNDTETWKDGDVYQFVYLR